MFWPCETRTSICRNLATISSGLYRFLAITVLLDVKDIPQVGPLQWGWIISERQLCFRARKLARRLTVAWYQAARRLYPYCRTQRPQGTRAGREIEVVG